MKRNYIVGLIVCSVPWVLLLVACGAKETAGMTAQPAATTEPALAEANPTKPPAMVVARSTATEPPLPARFPSPRQAGRLPYNQSHFPRISRIPILHGQSSQR